MDDSCAVCAEALEWTAYGPCGHREVCSTCVVRLRFVLDDPRCCICKTDNPFVFVTKAMGDYTRVITDFSVFPVGATEGKAGNFWYHEGTQAYFDDVDHYRMIKAMCRLSCIVCDKNGEEQGAEPARRRSGFRSIEQLKGHLFHQHRLFMCNLCLEGRKVFICEQKLYTRSQLNQHISSGDSEVDGDESERGGFMGHPMCEFCRSPFYGDNELYMHMSTEHFTCHICQRQHPGQYDYFKHYVDLERHNAIEHGGHMSRSKRNAALQTMPAKSKAKRPRVSSSSVPSERFTSGAAEARYKRALCSRAPIPERGIDWQGDWFASQQDVVEELGWEAFCSHPRSAVVPLVREFYANVPDHQCDVVMVRGCPVSFDAATISDTLQARSFPTDEYGQWINGTIDMEEILSALTVTGTTWINTRGQPCIFRTTALKREYRALFYFISARLMPCHHTSEVTWDRALLLFALIWGMSIDVGVLVHSMILNSARLTTGGLWYPSLITELCERAGVRWSMDEEVQTPRQIINEALIMKRMVPDVEDDPSISTAPLMSSSLAAPSTQRLRQQCRDTLESEVAALRQEMVVQRQEMKVLRQQGQHQLQLLQLLCSRAEITPGEVQAPRPPQPPAQPRLSGEEAGDDDGTFP